MKYLFLVFLLIPMQVHGLEVVASGRNAQNSAISTLNKKIDSLKAVIEILGTELGKLKHCNEVGALYRPNATDADLNGCAGASYIRITKE